MKKMHYGTLLYMVLLPLIIGMIAAAATSQEMSAYASMEKPPLSPPAWVFSIVWTFLYIMMGLASYFIFISEIDSGKRITALVFYAVQLAMNFCWSFLFFNWHRYLLAFIWLLILWFIVIACTIRFYMLDKKAGYLMIPYVLWLTFAAYLNLGTYVISSS